MREKKFHVSLTANEVRASIPPAEKIFVALSSVHAALPMLSTFENLRVQPRAPGRLAT